MSRNNLILILCFTSFLSSNLLAQEYSDDYIVQAYDAKYKDVTDEIHPHSPFPGVYIADDAVLGSHGQGEVPSSKVDIRLENTSLTVLFLSEDPAEVVLSNEHYWDYFGTYFGDRLPDYIEYNNKLYKVVGLHDTRITADEITLPKGLRYIEDRTFFDARKINFGNSLETIGHCAFPYVGKCEELTFPKSVLRILSNAINGTRNTEDWTPGERSYLSKIEFSPNTYMIQDGNFNYFPDVEEISLPYRLRYLGKNCFNGMQSLKSVHIGKYINEMADCFNDCPEIEEIIIDRIFPMSITRCFNAVDKDKCVVKIPHLNDHNSDMFYYTDDFWQGFKIVEVDKSGVETVIQEAGTVNPALYNLSGMPISSPDALRKGEIYIEKTAGRAEKKMAD